MSKILSVNRAILIIQLVIILILANIVYKMNSRLITVEKMIASKYMAGYSNSKRDSVIIDQNDIIIGDSTAKVDFVMYSNPNCIHCNEFMTKIFPKLNAEYIQNGKVRFVLKFIPAKNNEHAFYAAKTAICLNTKGYIFKFLNIIENGDYANDSVKLNAKIAEFFSDSVLLKTCTADKSIIKHLVRDKQQAKEFGVMGTPSFVVNGSFVVGLKSFNYYKEVIDNELLNCETNEGEKGSTCN